MLLRAAVIACLLPVSALAEVHEVRMLNRNATAPMAFEPDYLVIQPGDTVRFLATDRGHNAATIASMTPDGGQKFIGKIDEEIAMTLQAPGLWGIKCSPHYTMGMVMLIQVEDRLATEAPDLPADLPEAARSRMQQILARRP